MSKSIKLGYQCERKEGENAIQPAGVDSGVWALFNLVPAA